MTLLQDASDAFSKATKPIETTVKENVPGISKLGNDMSQEMTGKPWKEGLANTVRTGALTAVGSAVGGNSGAAFGAKCGEDLKNE
jgi:hypothetical protein